ncbi:hypothetical protein L9F63_010901 [Diploptera punctata]|uniref:Peroxisomal membrane protein 11C n=1 Tax=Diploptera punctata TaxID=6984 RepID=A0AAD8EQI4_DIPPU|nr:hypothetical protein L9F63_010901 [Diploptera punctata]
MSSASKLCTLKTQEPDVIMRIIGVLTNVADQLYFPLEHIAWASDQKIISVKSTPWWTASTVCWAVSLYLGLLKAVRHMAILQGHRSCMESDCKMKLSEAELLLVQRNELLNAFRCMGDLAQAIHYLPEGILWSGKLEKWHIGLLGTLTSVISLYQTYQRVIGAKKHAQ